MHTILRIATLAVAAGLTLTACDTGEDNTTTETTSPSASAEPGMTTPGMGDTSTPDEETSTATGTPGTGDEPTEAPTGTVTPGEPATPSTPVTPTTPAAPEGGSGDVTTPFLNNPNAADIKQFVERVELNQAGEVTVYAKLERVSPELGEQAVAKNAVSICDAAVSAIRAEENKPRPVTVLDMSGSPIATNAVDGGLSETCTYLS